MSFAEILIENQRWQNFYNYAVNGSSGVFTDTLSFQKKWKLAEIRIHCSTVFLSTEYLVAVLSAVNGSNYDIKLLSQNMLSVNDIILQYSEPLLFLSGDTITFNLSMVSAINRIGITCIGWAAVN